MTSQTVKSPAGETIEIVPDDEWIALTDTTLRGLNQWSGNKPLVMEALWVHGKFTHESGYATRLLMDEMKKIDPKKGVKSQPTTVGSLFRDPINSPAIERKVGGKKSYSIQLVALPERWYSKLLAQIAARKPAEAPVVPQEATEPPSPPEAPETAPVALLDEARASVALDGETQSVAVNGSEPEWTEADWEALKVDAPTIYETEPPIELHLASQVAMSLLTTVVEIITAGEADTTKLHATQRLATELDHVQGVLAQRLEENNRLRKQLREAQDIIQATREERDGLRTRLRATEQNLQAALKGETASAVNSEIHRRMDEIMRTAPKAKGD